MQTNCVVTELLNVNVRFRMVVTKPKTGRFNIKTSRKKKHFVGCRPRFQISYRTELSPEASRLDTNRLCAKSPKRCVLWQKTGEFHCVVIVMREPFNIASDFISF